MAEEQKTFDANPIMAKMREKFGLQMQSMAFLEVDYENLLKENENLKLEIEKKDKLIKAYEDKEKVSKNAKKK